MPVEPAISPSGTAYRDTGAPFPGAPVAVLIHGLGLSSAVMDGIGDALAATHRVVAYDLDGHGASPPRGARSLADLGAHLVGLMDDLRIETAALAGFSLGGMINRRVALDHPGRVTALVILNSPHRRAPETQARVEREAMQASAGGPSATIDAVLARWFTDGFRTRNPDVVEAVRRQVLATDPDAYARCRYILAAGVTELVDPDRRLELPTLVMTSEHDTGSTPDMAAAIAASIPGAALKIVPAVKHLGLVEEPEAFAGPVAAFLKTTGGC